MIKRSLFVLITIFLLTSTQFRPALADSSQTGNSPSTPIQHLVVLLQENHTFDNYFGTYPGVDGLPAGINMPIDPKNPSAGYVSPWHIGNSTITDLSHSTSTFKDQY